MGKSSGSKSGGSGQTVTNSTQKSEPWDVQIPYLSNLFSNASHQYDVPLKYYPDQTYAPMSGQTEQSLALQENRAMAGSPLVSNAQDTLNQTVSGDFLSSGNPYFSDMVRQIGNEITPMMDAKFSGSGRYGSGAHQQALTSALTDAAGELAYKNYGDERTRQMQGMTLAPTLANQDYYDIAKLGEVGSIGEEWAQKPITEAKSRWDFSQMEPWQRLSMLQNLIQGNYGGTTTGTSVSNTSTSQPGRSVGAGMLGGLLGGGSTGYMIGGWPGAAIGGGVGLLSGLF